MTKLQIISKLWSAIYDLVFLVKGTPTKSLEEIEADLDIVEYACRKYVDCAAYYCQHANASFAMFLLLR